MEFIDKIRESSGRTKYQMFKVLKLESPQAYISLIKSKERITIANLIKLRKYLGLTDTQLLDMIEEESINIRNKVGATE